MFCGILKLAQINYIILILLIVAFKLSVPYILLVWALNSL